MKKLYTALSCLVLVLLLGVGLFALLDKDATFSASENRALKKRPAPTLSALLDGSYVTSFDAYFSDTFPTREKLLSTNRSLNGFYYFSALAGETGPAIAIDFNTNAANGGEALPVASEQTTLDPEPSESGSEESTEPTEAPVVETLGTVLLIGDRAIDCAVARYEKIDEYAEAINQIADALGSDVRTISIAVPNSAEFYTPEEYHSGAYSQKNMIDYCYSKLNSNVYHVDAYSSIAAHTEEYLYFRTDHHWTQLGAYYAYLAFCDTMGFTAEPLDKFETGQYDDFLGSLYTYVKDYPQSKVLAENPDTLYFYRPFVEAKARYYSDTTLSDPGKIGVISYIQENVSNKYLCYLGGDHPVVVVNTDVEGPVCLLIKESYGNAFVPWLTSHYSRIVVIDPREFNREGKPELNLAAFAEEQGIDDCIVLNYPIMLSSKAYIDWMYRMLD